MPELHFNFLRAGARTQNLEGSRAGGTAGAPHHHSPPGSTGGEDEQDRVLTQV